jgi:hypothetical protein
VRDDAPFDVWHGSSKLAEILRIEKLSNKLRYAKGAWRA